MLKVVDKIQAGTATSDIVIGTPAFLGIELSSTTSSDGVAVGGVFDSMPAATAGIKRGSVITSVDGTSVTTSTQLSAIIAKHAVGDSVKIAWTSASGTKHSATIILVAGPAA